MIGVGDYWVHDGNVARARGLRSADGIQLTAAAVLTSAAANKRETSRIVVLFFPHGNIAGVLQGRPLSICSIRSRSR